MLDGKDKSGRGGKKKQVMIYIYIVKAFLFCPPLVVLLSILFSDFRLNNVQFILQQCLFQNCIRNTAVLFKFSAFLFGGISPRLDVQTQNHSNVFKASSPLLFCTRKESEPT